MRRIAPNNNFFSARILSVSRQKGGSSISEVGCYYTTKSEELDLATTSVGRSFIYIYDFCHQTIWPFLCCAFDDGGLGPLFGLWL